MRKISKKKPIWQVRQGHREKEILKEFVGDKKSWIAEFKRQLSQHEETEKVFFRYNCSQRVGE